MRSIRTLQNRDITSRYENVKKACNRDSSTQIQTLLDNFFKTESLRRRESKKEKCTLLANFIPSEIL